MKHIEPFSDKRQESWCIHCGVSLESVVSNRDHVPSKTLLQRHELGYLPTLEVCAVCNKGFSKDEEYLALFLRCCLIGSADPSDHAEPHIARALSRHEKLRAAIESSRRTEELPDGQVLVVWEPDEKRVRRIVEKNARGHALFELGEPMLTTPSESWFKPLCSMSLPERESFEQPSREQGVDVLPELGCRLMMRMAVQGMENDWVVVQDGVYRYRIDYVGFISVKSVLYEYLATEVRWRN